MAPATAMFIEMCHWPWEFGLGAEPAAISRCKGNAAGHSTQEGLETGRGYRVGDPQS